MNGITPKGEAISREIAIPDSVNKIEVSSGFKLVLDEQLPKGTALIYTYENIHPYVNVFIEGDCVRVSLDAFRFRNIGMLKITVSKDQYERFVASEGSSIVSEKPLNKTRIDVKLFSGSRFSAPINAKNLNVELLAGSVVDVMGQCENYKLTASAGSLAKGYDFVCNNVEANLLAGSSLKIAIKESLKGACSAGSMIYYKGEPSIINVNNSAGSFVRKK